MIELSRVMNRAGRLPNAKKSPLAVAMCSGERCTPIDAEALQ